MDTVDTNKWDRAHFGRILFDFTAQNSQELSVKKGDLVELVTETNPDDLSINDQDWLQVEDCQSSLRGLVPRSFIDTSIGLALATHDLEASSNCELTLKRVSCCG